LLKKRGAMAECFWRDKRATRRKSCPIDTLSTTHLHLVPRWRMSGATTLHPNVPLWYYTDNTSHVRILGTVWKYEKWSSWEVSQHATYVQGHLLHATDRNACSLASSCYVFCSSANSFLSLRTDRGHVIWVTAASHSAAVPGRISRTQCAAAVCPMLYAIQKNTAVSLW
jgi:hypothetical protein